MRGLFSSTKQKLKKKKHAEKNLELSGVRTGEWGGA